MEAWNGECIYDGKFLAFQATATWSGYDEASKEYFEGGWLSTGSVPGTSCRVVAPRKTTGTGEAIVFRIVDLQDDEEDRDVAHVRLVAYASGTEFAVQAAGAHLLLREGGKSTPLILHHWNEPSLSESGQTTCAIVNKGGRVLTASKTGKLSFVDLGDDGEFPDEAELVISECNDPRESDSEDST